ncbi:MAG: hypothetical protein JST00_00620 [Deltaproteobacteria bacterium]|nr:hypothetical protein [Deltaproteobacteria bacterium]
MRLFPRLSIELGLVGDALWYDADGAVLIASGAREGALIQAASGHVIARGRGVPRGRHAFSRGGVRVALGGNELRVLAVATGTLEQVHDTSALGAIADVALSPDASLAAAINANGMLTLLELPSGRRRFTLGGVVTRDNWSRRTAHHGASFDDEGKRLLTFGTTVDSTWGVAAHHGLPDEIDEIEDFTTVWAVDTGSEITTEGAARSRHETCTPTARWVRGSDVVLATRLGRFFSVLRPDLTSVADGYSEDGIREVHMTSDGRGVVCVDEEGVATWFSADDDCRVLARREAEADPLNGFGLPTAAGESPPLVRVFARSGEIVVESWPAPTIVARAPGTARRLAVRPHSRGRSFATLDEGRVTLWEVLE